jgi:hypothetical protein
MYGIEDVEALVKRGGFDIMESENRVDGIGHCFIIAERK